MTDDRVPTFEPSDVREPTVDDRRAAFVLRREYNRDTGKIESLDEARRKYWALGLRTPDEGDPYYD
jgi:hypothetical protein